VTAPWTAAPFSSTHWSEAESWSPERVREEQDGRLRQQLAHLAAHSDFYRQKADDAGVPLTSLTSVDDLRRFPFTEKQELRDSLTAHPPLGLHLAAAPADVIQIQASSGTTGRQPVLRRAHPGRPARLERDGRPRVVRQRPAAR